LNNQPGRDGGSQWKIINMNNEIFGACKHKTQLHRFLKETSNMKSTRTDEGSVPERGNIGRAREDEACPVNIHDVTPPPGNLSICLPSIVCV